MQKFKFYLIFCSWGTDWGRPGDVVMARREEKVVHAPAGRKEAVVRMEGADGAVKAGVERRGCRCLLSTEKLDWLQTATKIRVIRSFFLLLPPQPVAVGSQAPITKVFCLQPRLPHLSTISHKRAITAASPSPTEATESARAWLRRAHRAAEVWSCRSMWRKILGHTWLSAGRDVARFVCTFGFGSSAPHLDKQRGAFVQPEQPFNPSLLRFSPRKSGEIISLCSSQQRFGCRSLFFFFFFLLEESARSSSWNRPELNAQA